MDSWGHPGGGTQLLRTKWGDAEDPDSGSDGGGNPGLREDTWGSKLLHSYIGTQGRRSWVPVGCTEWGHPRLNVIDPHHRSPRGQKKLQVHGETTPTSRCGVRVQPTRWRLPQPTGILTPCTRVNEHNPSLVV